MDRKTAFQEWDDWHNGKSDTISNQAAAKVLRDLKDTKEVLRAMHVPGIINHGITIEISSLEDMLFFRKRKL